MTDGPASSLEELVIDDYQELYGDTVVDDLVDAYRTVWTQQPWNEVFGRKAAERKVEETISSGATALVAEYRGDSQEVLEATDYPDDPSYILDDEDPPDSDEFFQELGEPSVVGFTWALDAKKAGDVPETEEFQELTDGETAYISELGVVPGFQSRGIGSRLSEQLLHDLQDGYDRVILRTNPAAEKAINLYEKLGFSRTGLTDPEYPERVYLTKELEEEL